MIVYIIDVNTPNPDKKSIMMYVMCLFQSLPHASEEVAQAENTEQIEHTDGPSVDGGEEPSPVDSNAEVGVKFFHPTSDISHKKTWDFFLLTLRPKILIKF